MKRSKPVLQLENLEERCVPASAQLGTDGVLSVYGTTGNDSINLRQKSGQLSVDGTQIYNQRTRQWQVTVPATSVQRIDAAGYAGNDTINLNSGGVSGQQAITIPARIWGNEGNDQLVGGNGADTIWGGSGNDRIWGLGGNDQIVGEAGNDALYGGSGNDRLWGGLGNDGLFGGDQNDMVQGDQGADRYLWQQGDSVSGQATEDAVIAFVNSDRAWSESEIIAIDEGLGRLHARTNNTRLLKLASGGAINFVRRAGFNIGGDNDSRGTINMYDGGFYWSNWQWHGDAAKIAVHEIGHNWDSYDSTNGQENTSIAQFRALSGWVNYNPGTGYTKATTTAWGNWWYRTGTAFTSDYARSNPLEDFAESFATTLGYAGNTITQKMAQINSWLDSIATW